MPEPVATAAVPSAPEADTAAVDTDLDGEALAAFKANDNDDATEEFGGSTDVGFDVDDIGDADSALASFKKEDKSNDGADKAESSVDFTDELDSVGTVEESSGLASAKRAKNDVSAVDDAVNHDFSDQLEDVGSDQLTSGLKEGQQAKPDFNAEASEVDFSEDASLIGIHETEEETRLRSMNKLEEDEVDRNLNSFPKEGVSDLDFSDDLETLVTGKSSETSSEAAEPVQSESAEPSANASEPSGESVADAKSDVPEALTGDNAGDLQAELIDPAPAKKEEKAPVVADDGGLSLSSDDSAPLTATKKKADPDAADDGGLSLSADSEAPLTAPKPKANPDAADDGGLTADEPSSSKATSPDAAGSEAAVESAAAPAKAKPPEEKPAVAEKKAAEPAESTPAAEAPVEKTPVQKPSTLDVPNPAPEANSGPKAGGSGLVMPGQISNSVVPNFTPEDELEDDVPGSVTDSLRDELPSVSNEPVTIEESVADQAIDENINGAVKEKATRSAATGGSKKKLVAAIAGAAVLIGGGTFAFMNAGSIGSTNQTVETESMVFDPVKDANRSIEKVRVQVADLQPGADLESLSTGELLVNLSDSDNSSGIVDLEPYFLESGKSVKRGPRIGAAVPAVSNLMTSVNNRVPHPADQYFDEWSAREADLSLFLALLDNLIEKGDLEVAQQLSDRAKDKLFAVMSSQRLARAYSDVGKSAEVTTLMAMANRDTFAIKAPEERVLAISDYAYTEQAIGLNEDAMDTFLKTTILARSLTRPERRTVGLSSAAIYFQSAGRTKQAQELLTESLEAGLKLPENTAARDLAIRYISLSEARMGLFNQALEHARTITDPFATVSALHGIALAIESTGDDNNARKVLNMAYRAGSLIENEEERRQLLSKVVLASERE